MMKLSDSNFLLFASQHYDNPYCMDEEEFHDDLKRIKYIKRLLNKYHSTGQLKERLILNHIILFYNVFAVEAATKMLFLKFDKKLWPALKPFLIYLNYLPEQIEIQEQYILTSEIETDMLVLEHLKEMDNVRQ